MNLEQKVTELENRITELEKKATAATAAEPTDLKSLFEQLMDNPRNKSFLKNVIRLYQQGE